MNFLNEYKKLDNLCKDILKTDTGVTAYIQELEKLPRNLCQEEYKKLKHYRHIRNQIAHENDVSERDVCCAADVTWIKRFYRRILKETDPLSLARKKKRTRKNNTKKNNKKGKTTGFATILRRIFFAILFGLLAIATVLLLRNF